MWNCRSASSKGRRGEQRSRSSSPETGVGSGTKGSSTNKGRPFSKPISRALNMSVTQKVVGCLRSNVLTILNIAGVFSGVVLALVLRSSREEKWTQREIVYVGFVGESLINTTCRLHLFLVLFSITYTLCPFLGSFLMGTNDLHHVSRWRTGKQNDENECGQLILSQHQLAVGLLSSTPYRTRWNPKPLMFFYSVLHSTHAHKLRV